jgi:integrase/recombinase XerD
VHVPQPIPGNRIDPAGWPVVVEDFLTDLAARGYSPATVRARRQALAVFAGWCLDRGLDGPAMVSRPVLVRYQRWLFHYRKADGEPLTFRSQNARLLPVRALFAWCVKNGHLAANPASDLELPKVEQRLPKAALTADEAEQVLAVPDIATVSGLRDRALLEVLYCTGIRRAELAHLGVRDIDTQRFTLMVRQGKGKKDRLVPIHNRCLTWITAYLTDARPKLVTEPDDGTLFLTVDGTPFSLDRLTQLVRDHVKTSGVAKDGACHLFRHTLATVMLEGGADIRYVQAMLGHAELSTTQIYAQVSIRALQAVHRATHPGALRPVPSTRRTNDSGVDDEGEPEQFISTLRASPRELLAAALESEIEEENRAPAGSNGDPS